MTAIAYNKLVVINKKGIIKIVQKEAIIIKVGLVYLKGIKSL